MPIFELEHKSSFVVCDLSLSILDCEFLFHIDIHQASCRLFNSLKSAEI